MRVRLSPLAPIMKTEYHLGRKNQRTSRNLYKVQKYFDGREAWYKAIIQNDEFVCWNYCVMLPRDMNQITKEEADKFLFVACL